MSKELSHFDKDGKAVMVDISEKDETERRAVATGEIKMERNTPHFFNIIYLLHL